MFKIESYITPILLSYIDKYVENFKPEDSQVSLWSGGVSLYNLHLRTDIIQRDFNLPFRFVSGYIYELLIQVPWMKIVSDPIVVTINTIECILTLDRYPEFSATSLQTQEDGDVPPGYMQSLINKIVGNIAVRCNNFILKYVEGDIVVSLNIRHLSFDSTNANWESAFTEVTENDLNLRKLIQLNDLTFCVDESNAAGKIETYQEPLLFRCELCFRVLNKYRSVKSKRPYCTRLTISTSCLDFNISSQQIPIIMRLSALILALQTNELKIEKRKLHPSTATYESTGENATDDQEAMESWTGWLWSFVPALPSSYALDDDGEPLKNKFLMILCGVYIEKLSFTFKVPQYTTDVMHFHGGHKKNRFLAMCTLTLTSVKSELALPGYGNTCFRFGIEEILLNGGSHCTCGILDSLNPAYYIKSKNSLENQDLNKWPLVELENFENTPKMTSEEMLAICPALAVELMCHSTKDSENEDKYFEGDKMAQIAVGPLHVVICPSFTHRIQSVLSASEKYDYAPYIDPLPDLEFHELPSPTTDDYDLLVSNVPLAKYCLSATKLQISFNVWDHKDELKKSTSVSALPSKKTSNITDEHFGKGYIPVFVIECTNVDLYYEAPLNPRILVHTTCQLPQPEFIDACFTRYLAYLKNVQCFLLFISKDSLLKNEVESKSSPFIRQALTTQFSIESSLSKIIEEKFWLKRSNLSYLDFEIMTSNLSICGTAPRFITATHVLSNIYQQRVDDPNKSTLSTTSLIKDCMHDKNIVHLDIAFDDTKATLVRQLNVDKYSLSCDGLKIFAWDPVKRAKIEQVWILSAPEGVTVKSDSFLQMALQISRKNSNVASYICMKMESFSFNVDPLLWQLLTFSPTVFDTKVISANASNTNKQVQQRKSADELIKPFSKRIVDQKAHSLGHTSSDRDREYIHGSSSLQQNVMSPLVEPESKKSDSADKAWLQEYLMYNFTNFQHIQVLCDIASSTFHFPLGPVSALNSQSLHESMDTYVSNHKGTTFNLLNLGFPAITLQSASIQSEVLRTFAQPKLITVLNEPELSSFPWKVTFSNLSCFMKKPVGTQSGQQFEELPLLKPFNFNATIGVTVKTNKQNDESCNTAPEIKKDTQESGKPKKRKSQILPSSKEDPKDEQENNNELLSSLATYVHVDMGALTFAFNQNQIAFITHLLHALNDLTTYLFSFDKTTTAENCITKTYSKLLDDIMDTRASSDPIISSAPVTTSRSEEASCSSTSEHMGQSDSLIDKESSTTTKSTLTTDSGLFSVSSWIQWTVPKIMVKLYVEMKNKDKSQTCHKIQFTSEDIVLSLDIEPEYLKLKSKIVTADLFHFQRSDYTNKWALGDFNGLVIRGREKESSKDENNFLSLTFTKAKYTSLQNRWLDNFKKSKQFKKNETSDHTYVSEVVVSLQPLDILASLSVVELFSSIFLRSSIPIPCLRRSEEIKISNDRATLNSVLMDNSPSIFSAELWDSHNFPLIYLESSDIKIILPNTNFDELPEVLLFEIGSIKLTPHADNPICRQPLRPDLYQRAARTHLTDIPGSELEDRQYQISVKNIAIRTTMWTDLNDYEVKNSLNINENPAFVWNNLIEPNTNSSTMTICQHVELCFVLALAMSYRNELVCGPAIELNIVSDINILLSTSQLLLFRCHMEKFKKIQDKMNIVTIETQAAPSCTHSLYLYNTDQKCYKTIDFCRTSYINKPSSVLQSEISSNVYRSCALTLDSGVESDHISAIKTDSEFSRIAPKLYRKSPRLPAIHFDLYFAAGKLMINVFHQLSALGRKAKRKPDNIDIQNRRPSSKDGFIMHREFQAYSKDNTNEESTSSVQMSYRPLIYFEMTQPNMFVSKHNFQSKLQISLFDAFIGLGEEKYMPHIPAINDYNLTVFESKKGVINKVTGIPPALLTLKWIRCVGKSDIMTIDVDRPSNVTISIDYLGILNSIQALITPDIDDTQISEENIHEDIISPNKENSAMLWHMKSILTEFQVVKLKMTQLVLTCYPSKSKDMKMKLSVSSLQNSLTNSLRPESITQTVLVESAMITFQKLKESCIIMRPWTFGLELAVCWETWQCSDSSNNPIIRLSGEADKLSLDIGPEQISAIKILLKKWKESIPDLVQDNMELNRKLSLSNDSSASLNSPEVTFNPHILQEQYYKDDLRAGAFQFVEESSLPQAYQVTMSPDRLCWRYPQPRAIARIHSFPIPFKVDHNKEAKCISSVPCVLEYYSDITKTFEELISFELKEEQHVKLDLNIVPPKVIFATLWSVRMLGVRAGAQSNKEEYFDRNKYLKTEYTGLTKANLDKEKGEETNFPVKSSMLAACLRVDSYFEPKLIPKFQLGFEFKSIELNLFTPKIERLVSPPHMTNYSPQNFVPDSNIFLTMLLESSIIRFQKFDVNALVMGIESNLSISMLDSRYYLMYPVMKKCPFQVDFSVKIPAPLKNVQPTDVDVRVGDLTLDVSPSVVHTSLISLIALSDNLLEETSSHYDKYLWSMKKKYVICNDTTQTLLLSQKNTTESVILDPKCCIPYSWYDHSLPLLLCVGNEDGDWQLSQIEAINLDLIGTTQYNLDPVNYGAEGSVIVTVEQVNTGQNKVTIMGRLIMWNMVSEEILLKITHEDTGGNGRLSRTVLLKENSRALSMIIPYSSEKFLKVKFTNRESGISGDIPVTECPKENVPWLVKIPMLNNKNDFISIWCRVVCDKESKRICISLWPLYILKSHLPMGKEVIVATEEFDQSTTCYLPGKGLCAALLCHGTMKTKHSLIFDNSGNSGSSNKVSLHYGNVVQTKFFNETNVKSNMDILLAAFDEWLNEKKSTWPHSCVQSLCAGEWLPADEYPNTHITVNFVSGGPHISSLLVEICPWGLMVNTSNLFLSFNIPNGREICSAQPGTVAMTGAGFTNENFVVSILDDNGELSISDTISVKDSEIGIYEAKKPGSLHVENHCQLSIPSPLKVCFLTLYYEMKENINVFGAASTYLMMNHLDIEVNVAFVAVALSEESKTKFRSSPRHLQENITFSK